MISRIRKQVQFTLQICEDYIMFGKTKNYDVKTEEEEKYWLQILAIAIGKYYLIIY